MKTFRREICSLYLLVVFLLIPTVTNIKYQDLIDIKSTVFLITFGIFFGCFVLYLIGQVVSNHKMGLPMPKPKELAASLNPLDWSLIAFAAIILLSAVTSRFPFADVMLGTNAQLVGGLMLLSLILAYFMLSRGAEAARMGYIYIFYASSLFVIIFGALNKMQIDPLGMHKENVVDTFSFMTSTIGNIDYYYGYSALVLMFFAAYRADMDWDWKSTAVDLLLVCCFINIWTASASGVYAGLGFGFLALLLMSLSSFTRIRNLFWLGILGGIGGLVAEILHHFKPVIYYQLEIEISGKFQLHHFWALLGVASLAGWLWLGKMERENKDFDLMNRLSTAYKPLLFGSSIFMVTIECLVLFSRRVQDFTGRTFIWDDMKTAFSMFTLREKLIGAGPGSLDFALLDLNIHSPEALYFLTAHNEIFEFWFLLGFIGALIYISVIVCFFITYYRSVLANTTADVPYYREMCCCGVLFATFVGQAMTNGPYPVTTIIVYTVLALYRRYQIPDEEG